MFDNIKNTSRYWKKKRNEQIAKLENLGPFHFFFTLSCADARYEENFTSLLEGHTIVYNMINGRERAFVIVDDVEIIMDDFIKVNLSKHEMIKIIY